MFGSRLPSVDEGNFEQVLDKWVNDILDCPDLQFNDAAWSRLDSEVLGLDMDWTDQDGYRQDIWLLIQELLKDKPDARDASCRLMLGILYFRLQRLKFPDSATEIGDAARMYADVFLDGYKRQKELAAAPKSSAWRLIPLLGLAAIAGTFFVMRRMWQRAGNPATNF